jgi:hypothetical protein
VFLFWHHFPCTVVSATFPDSGKPTACNPIVIVLQAAMESKEEPADVQMPSCN